MNIIIFGRELPVYGICFFLGIFLSSAAAGLLCRRKDIPLFDVAGSGIFAMTGALLGSKLLFICISIRRIAQLPLTLASVMTFIGSGFVFYGGLAGGAAGLFIYVRKFNIKRADLADLYAVVLPLGHAVGRVGCFFAGCCYGVPCSHGHIYTQASGSTPLGIPLLPVQLIEAAALLMLFAVGLIIFVRRPEHKWLNTVFYLISYPLLRFTLEFFRGDTERGILLGLSTSQWCSLLILTALSAYLLVRKRLKAAAAVSSRK